MESTRHEGRVLYRAAGRAKDQMLMRSAEMLVRIPGLNPSIRNWDSGKWLSWRMSKKTKNNSTSWRESGKTQCMGVWKETHRASCLAQMLTPGHRHSWQWNRCYDLGASSSKQQLNYGVNLPSLAFISQTLKELELNC